MSEESGPRTGKAFIALSGCSVTILVAIIVGGGSCALMKLRSVPPAQASTSGDVPDSEAARIRIALLELSSEVSDPGRTDTDLTRVRGKLEALDICIESQRQDPAYLRLRALHESVRMQIKLQSDGTAPVEVPPLPASSIAVEPDDRYVGQELVASSLVTGRIFVPSADLDLRYGPGRFYMKDRGERHDEVGGLTASAGWTFLVLQIGVRGQMDLVEFDTPVLDDYRRAFAPHLGAEKELMRSDSKLTVWRSLQSTTSKTKVVWLTRVYMLPMDSMQGPILEIHRQSAAKRIWIQL